MAHKRLNAYQIMWLFVFFDLPVVTKKERKIACKFRNTLLQNGFNMLQYSVYIRHCASRESMDVYIRRIKINMPESGHISILSVTDKQYGNILNFFGIKAKLIPAQPLQLELF
jgi:CRISPR-associated protein Cas2